MPAKPGPDGTLWHGIAYTLAFYAIGFAAVVLAAQLTGCDRDPCAKWDSAVCRDAISDVIGRTDAPRLYFGNERADYTVTDNAVWCFHCGNELCPCDFGNVESGASSTTDRAIETTVRDWVMP